MSSELRLTVTKRANGEINREWSGDMTGVLEVSGSFLRNFCGGTGEQGIKGLSYLAGRRMVYIGEDVARDVFHYRCANVP